MGLSGLDGGAGRETWQMGSTLAVLGQSAVGYNRGAEVHWANPGLSGKQVVGWETQGCTEDVGEREEPKRKRTSRDCGSGGGTKIFAG